VANDIITTDMLANEALVQLENNLVMGKLVYRDAETKFGEEKIGATVKIRRPVQYKVRTGPTAVVQDTSEGKVTVQVDQQKGVDLEFSSTDLTLSIDKFSERYLKSAMVDLAQIIDNDVMAAHYAFYNYAGTYGNKIASYTHFAAGVEMADNFSVPKPRVGVLAPTDWHAINATFTALPGAGGIPETAIKQAKLPGLAGVDTYMSQNVIVRTNGSWAGSPVIDGNSQNVPYAGTGATAVNTRNTWTQTLNVKGLTASTGTIKRGDVFTIANVNALNPRSKNKIGTLQQFTVVSADVTADGAGKATITVSPPIISDATSPYQTVDAAPIDNAAITLFGAANATARQNLIFHQNAIALTMVPMILPPGAVTPSRASYKGVSIRVIPVYDGVNDTSMWRLDVLYGVTPLDPRLGVRLSGG
jgi:hypothetical protein